MSDFKEFEAICVRGALRVSRGWYQDGKTVVRKWLAMDAQPEAYSRLQREFALLSKIDLPGVVKPLDLLETDGGRAMLLEDIGGKSLRHMLASNTQLSLEHSLNLAMGLAETLAQLHQQRIVHKAINPDHIIINVASGEFRLIGFGFADELPQSEVAMQPPGAIEGDLTYISPEQTGRMNRRVDYRTDFYSLGITLYELLTGASPFKADDALGMVHCHIAKVPASPHELDPDIPEVLSDMVMKLMAKMADDRYQNAWGLKADLEKCLIPLRHGETIRRFELGLEDFSGQLRLPQRLYGRDKEIDQLSERFNRVKSGERGLLLIAGHPGIGKTALVHESRRLIVEKQGNFIEGKFEQLQRNVPYFAWIQAFKSFLDYLLMESETRLEQWKQIIHASLGRMGRVLTDVIPNLELIIGAQPEVPILGAQEAQNRFNFLFAAFVKALATGEHPLVVFLDDLQWIDAASLNLMQTIMSGDGVPNMLVIGAYRDSEVDDSHPLLVTIETLRKQGCTIEQLMLEKISEQTVNELIADALHHERSETPLLTHLIYSKIGGNPFFLFQTLMTLTQSQAIVFDIEERRWKWKLSVLKEMEIADDVVELMMQKLSKLPQSAQQILQRAACIGARFNVEMLSDVCDKSADAVLADLRSAFEEMLVISSGSEIEFVHDRIQQAAYSLACVDARKATHWRIGKLLLQESSQRIRNEYFFNTVNHLIIGAYSFATSQEKQALAEMTYQAGLKAKASAAFSAAMEYFETGLKLLGEKRWEDRYTETLAYHQEACEAACLCGQYERMRQLTETTHREPIGRQNPYWTKSGPTKPRSGR
ncbi:MAG: AAA family ATPase [Candidatus Thiodiazotropha sp.]